MPLQQDSHYEALNPIVRSVEKWGGEVDNRGDTVLNLAKYGGYLSVFWVSVAAGGVTLDGAFLFLVLALAADTIRVYYAAESRRLVSACLVFQLAFVYAFIFVDGTAVGSILMTILVAETQIRYSRPIGDRTFVFAVAGFVGISILSAWWRDDLSASAIGATAINCLILFFAYGISYFARRQNEERARAEEAMRELERSRRELETAYQLVLDGSRQRERLMITEERNRMARELHDTLAHTLTTVVVGLEAAGRLLDVDRERAVLELGRCQDQVRSGLDDIRRTVRALRPRELDELGFATALRGLTREYEDHGVHIDLEFRQAATVPADLELPLYRLVQESITNSVRHGRANRISVRLTRTGDLFRVEIEDNGVGCPDCIEGYGMQGIRERAAAARGRAEFIDRSPSGFLVRVEMEASA